jgi:hypothetical protein
MFLNGLINKSINGNTIFPITRFSSCMPTGHSYFTGENFVIFYAKNTDRNITCFEILTASLNSMLKGEVLFANSLSNVLLLVVHFTISIVNLFFSIYH